MNFKISWNSFVLLLQIFCNICNYVLVFLFIKTNDKSSCLLFLRWMHCDKFLIQNTNHINWTIFQKRYHSVPSWTLQLGIWETPFMHCNGQVDKIVPNGLGSIPFQNTVPGMRRKISSKVLCSISKRNTVSIFFSARYLYQCTAVR